MDSSNPKVSFIPKGSLVREESFLERRRPQSAIGLLAGFVFVLAVGSYAGLYYYNNILNKTVVEKTTDINKTQQGFKDAPEVGEARVFRARADLAHELLKKHTVVSPVFVFLSDNTTESIMYDKFSFKNSSDGAVLELSGEAPTYAALAFQADVFRNKTEELSKFSVVNVALTKFGTIAFNFTMTFNPVYLLYTNNVSGLNADALEKKELAEISAPDISTQASAVDTDLIPIPMGVAVAPVILEPSPSASSAESGALADDLTVATRDEVATTTTTKKTPVEQSVLRRLWSKFKFW
ncbi:MAG: hypothetical protein WAV98_03285 [Minisyncoccia bacterium]